MGERGRSRRLGLFRFCHGILPGVIAGTSSSSCHILTPWICGINVKESGNNIGKANLEDLLRNKESAETQGYHLWCIYSTPWKKPFHSERCSGHQVLESKKQEPGRLRGMRMPVVFEGTSGRGQYGGIRYTVECRPPFPIRRQGAKDCSSGITERISEEGKTSLSGRGKEVHLRGQIA